MWFKRKKGGNNRKEKQNVTVRTITIDELQSAINAYANENPDISLRTLVKDNHEVDTDLLVSQLNGRPDRPFYMSKETFELFEDPDYPKWIDRCQLACDQYVLETDEEPITPGDSTRKVNYLKVQHYLKEKPPFQLYLHPQDRMVTHKAPEK